MSSSLNVRSSFGFEEGVSHEFGEVRSPIKYKRAANSPPTVWVRILTKIADFFLFTVIKIYPLRKLTYFSLISQSSFDFRKGPIL